MVHVTFLISTFDRREVTLRTLRELRTVGRESKLATQIIVVDNASSDGSADAIAREFPGIHLIRGTNNRGACAKNAGLPHAAGRYVVFLDDDSYPDTGSLRRMVLHFEADPMLGAAVFDIVLPDGSHECSAYPNVFIGCGTGFRADALRAVGGLPDDFFMQAEEYDLSLRLLDAGWAVQRFDDLRVTHLKTVGARVPTRTTRLDVRNNLLLIFRRFPAEWVVPFAIGWMRRYRWIAQTKGWPHRAAFWRGLAQGLIGSLKVWRRQPVSREAFEQFSRIQEISDRFAQAVRENGYRSIVLIDLGKNVLPFILAAQVAGVRIVAIADPRVARTGRRYHGIPIVTDDVARARSFDAAIVANVSPVHAALRARAWREADSRPVIDLLASPQFVARAA